MIPTACRWWRLSRGEFVNRLEAEWADAALIRVLVVALRTPDAQQTCVFGQVKAKVRNALLMLVQSLLF